ncbi:uncharacterized protein LOC134189074 [Corticium candelabrum]|uniref:uncharacterized protein LOC134189074 n=1 Tax=Corticium candelabrum TaxID=121492 RepID=UPI002E25B44B|nr:uncharacterized protein LOC134189074 [Corticium candelabrum]
MVEKLQRKYGSQLSLAQNPVWMTGFRQSVARTNEECFEYQLYGKWRRQSLLVGRILEPLMLIQTAVAKYPDVGKIVIRRPVFITGTGRNGSTLLHNLLSYYSNVRYLTMEECCNPVPDIRSKAFDLKWYQNRQSWWRDLMSASKKTLLDLELYSHPLSASNPEECILLLSKYLFWMPLLSFGGPYVGTSWGLSQTAFACEAYKLFKRDLQLLLYCDQLVKGFDVSNTRYVLKCPYHTPFHDVIRQVFSDAVIIRLHRDPVEVVPSYSSMMTRILDSYPSKNNSRATIGRDVMKWVEMCCNRMVSEGTDSGMIDVRYADLMKDPIGMCSRIAAAVGLEHNSDVEKRLIAHLEDNPKHKYGIHVYNVDQFGLNSTEIRRNLAKYCETFNV